MKKTLIYSLLPFLLSGCLRYGYNGDCFYNVVFKFKDNKYADYVLVNTWMNQDSAALLNYYDFGSFYEYASEYSPQDDTAFFRGRMVVERKLQLVHGDSIWVADTSYIKFPRLPQGRSPYIKIDDEYYMFSWIYASEYGRPSIYEPCMIEYNSQTGILPIKWSDYECEKAKISWGDDEVYERCIFEDIRAISAKSLSGRYEKDIEQYRNIIKSKEYSPKQKQAAIDSVNKYVRLKILHNMKNGTFKSRFKHLKSPKDYFND